MVITQATMEKLIAENPSNNFLRSIAAQLKVKELTEPQKQAIYNYMGVDLENPEYKTKTIYKVRKHYNRVDYHGDYLVSTEYVFVESLDEIDFEEVQQDAHAAQYGDVRYFDVYTDVKEITIPVTDIRLDRFMAHHFEDFTFMIEKLNRNRFRSAKGRNLCIQGITTILNGKPNQSIIDQVTGKAYRGW